MLRAITPTLLLFLAFALQAQVVLDRPLVLDGAQATDRRIGPLSDPVTEADAINARSAQRGGYRFAGQSGGGDAWNVVLSPAPTQLAAGTDLYVLADSANSGPVQVTVNGMGPYPLLLNTGSALSGGEVKQGQVVAIVFDGMAFRLVGPDEDALRSCPAGFVAVNEQFCIEVTRRDTLDLDEAAMICGAMDARLCTWGEFHAACRKAVDLGITDFSGNEWEWTNSSANGDGLVRVAGAFSCYSANTSPAWNSIPRKFRCCMDR